MIMRYNTLISALIWTFVAATSSSKNSLAQYSNENSKFQHDNSTTTIEHPARWYSAYLREYHNGDYEVKVIDKSFDTRVANILYTKFELYLFRPDSHRFEFDDDHIVRREYESYISGPEVDQKLCTEHLIKMNELLDELEQISSHKRASTSNSSRLDYNERHVLMARVLDSYGRYESGVLIGRAHLIGSSEQCLGTKLKLGPESDQQVVGTRYCKASLGFDSDLDPGIRERTRAYIQVGVCLPNTCHSNSLKDNKHLIQRLVNSQFSMPQSIYLSKHREVNDLFCLNDNNTSIGLPLSGKILAVAAVIWTVLLIGATIYGDTLEWRPARIIAECFNMKGLLQDFIDSGSENVSAQSTVNLNALNIVKVIGMMLIVIAHSVTFVLHLDPNVFEVLSSLKRDRFLALIIGTNHLVDTFFVLSGLIFSYMKLKSFQTEIESSNTLAQLSRLASKLFFDRYLRLVPLYFIVHWFNRSVLLYLGSGPLWDPGFNQYTVPGSCKRESWLTPLTPMSAYLPTGQQCLPQTWSLGVEIFSIILTTPVLIIMVKKPKLSILVLSTIICASGALFYEAFLNMGPVDLEAMNLCDGDLLHLSMNKYSLLYTCPVYRSLSILSGIICGYFLYHYERDRRQWPSWFTKYATRVAIASAVMTICFYSMMPTLLRYNSIYYEHHHIILYCGNMLRLAWTLASCVLSLRVLTDCQQNRAVRLFAGKFGRMMSKINLAVLLIHNDVLLMKQVSGRNHTENYSVIKCLDVFIVGSVYIVVFAILVHVLVESPISKMIRLILQGHKHDSTARKRKQH